MAKGDRDVEGLLQKLRLSDAETEEDSFSELSAGFEEEHRQSS